MEILIGIQDFKEWHKIEKVVEDLRAIIRNEVQRVATLSSEK